MFKIIALIAIFNLSLISSETLYDIDQEIKEIKVLIKVENKKMFIINRSLKDLKIQKHLLTLKYKEKESKLKEEVKRINEEKIEKENLKSKKHKELLLKEKMDKIEKELKDELREERKIKQQKEDMENISMPILNEGTFIN